MTTIMQAITKIKKDGRILRAMVIFSIILLISIGSQSSAQSIAKYVVSRSTGISYNSIAATGTGFPSWRNPTANLTDDNRSFAVNMGFDFYYMGARYTQVSVCTNGYVDLSSSTADGNVGNPYRENPLYLSQPSGTLLAIAPFYEDLWTGNGGTTTLANSIKYQLSGIAPNRVFTIEYIGMDNFTAPNDANLNFQVKFYESTGVIEIVYGNMTAGTSAHSYGCAINGPTMSATPAATELLEQQTANTATFSNTPKYNLTTVPASYSKLAFTPPAPAAPTSLTFTAVTKSSMTLNWVDNANNELKYAIYRSTDGINYTYHSLVAANTVTTNITSLASGTTYYWNIYAVTEGKMSNALIGSQATMSSGTYTSNVASGNWNTAATWSGPGGIPGLGDNVIIANGATITIDVNAQCNNLTIGQGASGILLIGNSTTARTLTIQGDIIVSNGGIFKANNAFAATHILNLTGNIINNGTLDFSSAATSLCDIVFNKNGNQSISGSGASTKFNKINLNMGASNGNILDITCTNFAPATGFLTLTNGSFKMSTLSTITPFNTNASIPLNAGLIVNNPGAIVNTLAGTITFYGLVNILSGTMNIGNAANNNLTSNGGTYIQSGGIVNIAGRFDRTAPYNLTYFTMSGGTMIVATNSSSTAAMAPFHMTEEGSVFTMSGGNIIIRKAGAGNLGYLNTLSSGVVTGGTIQIGDASTPAAQILQITTVIPVFNLMINSSTATGKLFTNSITVLNDVQIATGVLDANALNINLGGNWINTSAIANPFIESTGTVTFNGTSSQTISSSTAQESFYNLVIANTGNGITMINSTDVDVANSLTMNSGIVNSGNDLLILTNSSPAALVYNNGFVNGIFRRYIANNTGNYLFPVGSGITMYDRHRINLLNNNMPNVSFIDAQVINLTQSGANNDAALNVMQKLNPITATVGQAAGQTIIWTLTPDVQPSGGSYGVQLMVENSGLSASDDNSFCPLKRSNFTSYANFSTYDATTDIPSSGSVGRIFDSGNGYASRTGYTSFSQFAIGKSSGPLPVKLVLFDANAVNHSVLLTWSTATELNNDYFTIERSINGVDFLPVLKVDGSGNSNVFHKYSGVDNNPFPGVSYYRLKQTDLNGQSETFKVVAVSFADIDNDAMKIKVWPNAFKESFNTQFQSSNGGQMKLEMINMNGAIVFNETVTAKKGINTFHFETLSEIKPGKYILRIKDDNEIFSALNVICGE